MNNLAVCRIWSTSRVVRELPDHCVMLGWMAVARSELWLDHLTMVWRFVLVADWLAFFQVQVRICFVESIF